MSTSEFLSRGSQFPTAQSKLHVRGITMGYALMVLGTVGVFLVVRSYGELLVAVGVDEDIHDLIVSQTQSAVAA